MHTKTLVFSIFHNYKWNTKKQNVTRVFSRVARDIGSRVFSEMSDDDLMRFCYENENETTNKSTTLYDLKFCN